MLDYHLADGTALDAIPRLRAAAPESRIVILTALAADRVLTECLRAGASGFVTKQQSMRDVVQAVRTAAAGNVAVAGDAMAAAMRSIETPESPRPTDLTAREREVLALLASGQQNREIAGHLYLSVNTVRNHVAAILDKLGARTRSEAVAIALRQRLVTLDPPATGNP